MARAWKQDAYLVDAETTFWPTDSDEFRHASFSFRSRSSDVIGLYIGYDPATDSFKDEWLSIFNEDPRYKEEIADRDWRLDSVEALDIAQGAGGSEFLARHLDSDLTLYLRLEKREVDQDGRPVWFVAYYAGMPPFADRLMVIDAVTGQVLEAGE